MVLTCQNLASLQSIEPKVASFEPVGIADKLVTENEKEKNKKDEKENQGIAEKD